MDIDDFLPIPELPSLESNSQTPDVRIEPLIVYSTNDDITNNHIQHMLNRTPPLGAGDPRAQNQKLLMASLCLGILGMNSEFVFDKKESSTKAAPYYRQFGRSRHKHKIAKY